MLWADALTAPVAKFEDVRYNLGLMKRAAIGVDIGGTNVKLGLVDEKGKVLLRGTFLTKSAPSKKALLIKLAEHIRSFQAEAERRKLRLAGVGIGAPGPIDVTRGFVYSFPNIRGWENVPFKKLLQQKIQIPVVVDNDANAMAWGEYCFGAGKGARNIIALTLGTGIGGGIVLDGKLFHGPHFSAAEFGHMVVDVNGLLCGCGNRGCIETFVGNGYFVKDVQEHLDAGGHSLLREWTLRQHKELTPKLVQEAARQGDKLAIGQWKKTGAYLGTWLAGLANVFGPERIILGGGVAQAGALLLDPVRETLKKKAFPIASRFVKVLPALLGPDAGLIGAAALAFPRKK